jgi:hypothetical protein
LNLRLTPPKLVPAVLIKKRLNNYITPPAVQIVITPPATETATIITVTTNIIGRNIKLFANHASVLMLKVNHFTNNKIE